MPGRRRKNKDTPLVALAWGLNIVGLLAIAVVGMVYLAMRPAHAAPGPQDAGLVPVFPTVTPAPQGVYYLPTITPNPLSTMIVVQSPTPFVLEGGNRATIVGYSVSGRPIEVYTFGNGPN